MAMFYDSQLFAKTAIFYSRLFISKQQSHKNEKNGPFEKKVKTENYNLMPYSSRTLFLHFSEVGTMHLTM